jgi:hypothetical protein
MWHCSALHLQCLCKCTSENSHYVQIFFRIVYLISNKKNSKPEHNQPDPDAAAESAFCSKTVTVPITTPYIMPSVWNIPLFAVLVDFYYIRLLECSYSVLLDVLNCNYVLHILCGINVTALICLSFCLFEAGPTSTLAHMVLFSKSTAESWIKFSWHSQFRALQTFSNREIGKGKD